MSDMWTSLLELLAALRHFFGLLLSLLGGGEVSECECFVRLFVLAIAVHLHYPRMRSPSCVLYSLLRRGFPYSSSCFCGVLGEGSFPTVLLVPVTPVHNLMVRSSVISRILQATELNLMVESPAVIVYAPVHNLMIGSPAIIVYAPVHSLLVGSPVAFFGGGAMSSCAMFSCEWCSSISGPFTTTSS